MASVWAISGVLGPLAGGLIVDHFSWAWIFWVNLPIGIVTILGLAIFLHESVETHHVRIDYLGALLFSVSIGSLLALLTETDSSWWILLALAVLFVATGAFFLIHERRAPEPIVSIKLWTRRLIATSAIATLLAGMALIGLTTVLPIYVQGVLGGSPLVGGFTLSALIIGWPLAVMSSGRLYRTFGIRRTLRVGSVMFPVGAVFLLFLGPHSSPLLAATGSFLMGCGMGLLSITSIATVQDSVEWSMRGSATASLIFARSLGSTLGATAIGALLNLGITYYGTGALATRLHDLLNQPTGLTHLSSDPAIRAVFDQALRWSFVGVVVMAGLTFVATWLIPVTHRPASAAPAAGTATTTATTAAATEAPHAASH
jgi:MFS family permease